MFAAAAGVRSWSICTGFIPEPVKDWTVVLSAQGVDACRS